MTTIWQTEGGHYEDGCGCKYERVGDRFVVVERNPKCQRTHPSADTQTQNQQEERDGH